MNKNNSYGDYSLENTCRTCASNYKTDDLIPLFITHNNVKPIDIIKNFHTNDFQICENDNLPTNICKNCIRNFKILLDFINLCECSELLLRNYFRTSEMLELDENLNDSNELENMNKNEFEENCLSSLTIETISNNEYFDIIETETYYTDEEHLENDELDIILNDIGSNNSLSKIENDSCSTTEKLTINCSKKSDVKEFRKMICEICNKSLFRKYYDAHMKKHRPVIYSKCKICDNIVEDIELHNKNEHKIFVCQVCDISFPTARKQKAHIFKMHDRTGHICNICERAFLYPNLLRRHMEYVHAKNTPKAICDICGKLFKNKSVLANHRAVHNKTTKSIKKDTTKKLIRPLINTFQCPFCTLKFRNLFGLKNHSKFHRKDKNSENYKHVCKYCNQRFKRSDHLELHIDLVHLKNLPFTCPTCSKKFPKQYVLNQHIRKMHTEGPRECQYCNKPYLSKGTLNRHIKLHHLKEQYYKCDICFKVFSTIHKYETHMKTHTVEEEREIAEKIYAEILSNAT